MQIKYKNRGIQKVCEINREAEKKYGVVLAEAIHKRIDQIKAMDTVEELIQYRIGKCHALTGNLQGLYAIHLTANYRLLFSRKTEGTDTHIQIVVIDRVDDYH